VERPASDWLWSGGLSAAALRLPLSPDTAGTVERIADETGACGIVGDVGRKEDIYPVALQVTANLGGLDALINGASTLGPTPLVPLADTECEDFEQALVVNVLGPFRLTRALFGALAASAQEGRGALQERRRGQARAWLWERIDAGLRDAFRGHAAVRARLDATLAAVDAGRLPVSVAARRLLDAFVPAAQPVASGHD